MQLELEATKKNLEAAKKTNITKTVEKSKTESDVTKSLNKDEKSSIKKEEKPNSDIKPKAETITKTIDGANVSPVKAENEQ